VYFMKDGERLLSELCHYFLHILHTPGRHDPLIIVPVIKIKINNNDENKLLVGPTTVL
jgi:hypothetical protein